MNDNLVLVNGKIHTMNPAQPQAQVLAIRDGYIAYLGDDVAAARQATGAGAEVLNLRGRAVLPGLTDAHLHLGWFSQELDQIDLEGVASLPEALAMVQQRVAQTPPGLWIGGKGWNHHLWGGILPNRQQLDAVAPDNPVLLTRKDGHSVWANSAALAAANINTTTPDPPGGVIIRNQHGEPSGVLQESSAMNLLYAVRPLPTVADMIAMLQLGIAEANQRGLTGCHNIFFDIGGPTELAALRQMHTDGRLKLRVTYLIRPAMLDETIAAGLRSGDGDDWLRFSHLKLFSDGALGSLTADMLQPFVGSDSCGLEVTTQEQLITLISKAARADIASAVHAIGDRAVRRALDALAVGKQAGGLHLRHRIEHAQLVSDVDFPRFAQLGVIASMQPIHCPSDWQVADQHWGVERARRGAYAFRTLRDNQARLAFGSDCPVETLDPLLGIHAAVTRQRPDNTPPGGWNPEQNLTVAEAVTAYTHGSAYAAGEETTKGSLEVGKVGDAVILDTDIFTAPPQEIKNVAVLMTIIGGQIVYRKAEW